MRRRHPLPPGFGALWTTVAVDLIGFGVVLPILPRYAEDLKVSPTVIGLVVGVFSLAQLICAPLLGRLSDRIGRKPVLLLSLVGTAVGSLLTGLAGAVWLLLLGRIVDGASGASVSVAQAAVTDVAPAGQRARLLGLLGAAFGVGFVIGPAIGALAALDSPRLPFFIAAAIAAGNALVAIRRLPETHPDRASTGDGPSHAVPSAPEAPEDPAAPVDAGQVAPVAVPEDTGSARRRLPPGVPALFAVAFVGLLAFSGFEGTFALLVHDRFGLTLSSTGVVFTVIGVALVLVQGGLVHPVTSRIPEGWVLRLALAANGAGLVLIAADVGWVTLAPGLVLLVVGEGLVTPVLASAVAARVVPRRRGHVLGLQQSAGSLARFAGPFAAGALYQHVGIPSPYLIGGLLVLVAIALVPRHRPTSSVPLGGRGPGGTGDALEALTSPF